MSLDPLSLGAASIVLAIVSGALLIFAWLQNRRAPALLFWGLGYCLAAAGIVFRGAQETLPGNLFIGNAVMAIAFGIQYAGCRIFNGRPRNIAVAFIGLLVWSTLWPFVAPHFAGRLIVMSVIATVYTGLMAFELWRNAPQRLTSQSATVLVFALAALFWVIRGVLGLFDASITGVDTITGRWSATMALLFVVYVPTSAFLLLSMSKELAEFAFRQEALRDPLTHIPNRRAFFAEAAKLTSRHRNRSVSCLLFDLDDFKLVNDTYGHEMGDRVLTIFAETLAGCLPSGTYGRIGGDEFGAVVVLDEPAADILAEKIRQQFARAVHDKLGGDVASSVSIGCVSGVGSSLATLMTQADTDLYRVKAHKRHPVPPAGGGEVVPFEPSRTDRRRYRDTA